MKYPLGIQTFSELRQENYLYLDKTALIYQLIDTGKAYFLSRPRRFGKSLLISTFESLFRGERDLFTGLAINDTDYDFVTYPVMILEFSNVDIKQPDDLRHYIVNLTNFYAQRYNVTLTIDSWEQRFAELVRNLHESSGQRVVLLIDEYDKPILDHINDSLFLEIKQVMNTFYSGVKSLDRYLKFVFITGVSKFAKVSVFSGMNNLTDISLDGRYATLCGVTEQELVANFAEAIDELAKLEGADKAAMMAKIKYWYNGYTFEENAPGVYNPYSLLSLFNSNKFKNHWFTTATPTFLIELIKAQQFNLADLNDFEVDELFFAASEPEQISPESVLLQTGYLTIVDYNDGWYKLDFPNYEVKYAFNRAIVQNFAQLPPGDLRYIRDLSQSLNKQDVSGFINTLQIFFANVPYDINLQHEKYYQSLFYALFTLLGYQVEAEVRTNNGRIDCVLQTDNTIYIIEFKLFENCESALKQIIDKQYSLKYQASGKQLILLGVEFDQDNRNIGDFVEQRL